MNKKLKLFLSIIKSIIELQYLKQCGLISKTESLR